MLPRVATVTDDEISEIRVIQRREVLDRACDVAREALVSLLNRPINAEVTGMSDDGGIIYVQVYVSSWGRGQGDQSVSKTVGPCSIHGCPAT